MAQLYRRVLGLSDRRQLDPRPSAPRGDTGRARILIALLGLGLGAPEPARADEPQAVDEGGAVLAQADDSALAAADGSGRPELEAARSQPLSELGAALASADGYARLRAYDALRTLRPGRVDEVEARLRELRTTNDPPSAAAFNTLVAIRHHMGSERADDPVDLAIGLRQLLGGARVPSATTLQVAERMALLRGLEHMDALAADRVMIGFFQRGWSVWQWEARHLVARRGLRMLPALIEGRSAGNPEVRRWAVGSIRRLGVDSVGAAVQMASPEVLPDVLRAYASLNDLNAMPAVITFVDHPDPAVREASRTATARYERNAIWQLRLAYRNKLGENADLSWSWQTTMQRLFDGLDARRLEPAHALLAEGLAAAELRDWETMRDRYERALRREPLLPRRVEMAAGYADAALAALESGDPADEDRVNAALTQLRRALRLGPDDPRAADWEATVAFHEAERARVRGVLDEGAYEAVLAARPGHSGARAVLADIEGGGVGDVEAAPSSLAASLMGLLGVLLLLPYARLRPLGLRAWSRCVGALSRGRGLAARSPVSACADAALAAEVGVPADATLPAEVGVPAAHAPAAHALQVGVPGVPAAHALQVGVPGVPAAVPGSGGAGGVMLGASARWARAGLEWVARGGRRVAYFVRSLRRRIRPTSEVGDAALSVAPPTRAQRMRQRALAALGAASKHMPRVARVASWARGGLPQGHPREAAGGVRVRKRPTLEELRSTLAMLVNPEPPEVPRVAAPRSPRRETDTTQSEEGAPQGADLVLAQAAASPAELIPNALDAEDLVAADGSELDELLFGDSDLLGDPASESDLFALAGLYAHDTSPGLLEAPDTIPG